MLSIERLDYDRRKSAGTIKTQTPNPRGYNKRNERGPKVQVGVRLHRHLVEGMDKTPYNRTQIIEAALESFLRREHASLKIEPLLLMNALRTVEPTISSVLSLETVEKALNLLSR